METKEIPVKIPFWKSKIFILNALTAIVGLSEYLTPLNIVSAPVLAGVNTIGNLILRSFFSEQKLTTKTSNQLNK